jgi:hypothetical protein
MEKMGKPTWVKAVMDDPHAKIPSAFRYFFEDPLKFLKVKQAKSNSAVDDISLPFIPSQPFPKGSATRAENVTIKC